MDYKRLMDELDKCLGLEVSAVESLVSPNRGGKRKKSSLEEIEDEIDSISPTATEGSIYERLLTLEDSPASECVDKKVRGSMEDFEEDGYTKKVCITFSKDDLSEVDDFKEKYGEPDAVEDDDEIILKYYFRDDDSAIDFIENLPSDVDFDTGETGECSEDGDDYLIDEGMGEDCKKDCKPAFEKKSKNMFKMKCSVATEATNGKLDEEAAYNWFVKYMQDSFDKFEELEPNEIINTVEEEISKSEYDNNLVNWIWICLSSLDDDGYDYNEFTNFFGHYPGGDFDYSKMDPDDLEDDQYKRATVNSGETEDQVSNEEEGKALEEKLTDKEGFEASFEALTAKMLSRYSQLARTKNKNNTVKSAEEGASSKEIEIDDNALRRVSCEFAYSGRNLRKLVTEALQKGII